MLGLTSKILRCLFGGVGGNVRSGAGTVSLATRFAPMFRTRRLGALST